MTLTDVICSVEPERGRERLPPVRRHRRRAAERAGHKPNKSGVSDVLPVPTADGHGTELGRYAPLLSCEASFRHGGAPLEPSRSLFRQPQRRPPAVHHICPLQSFQLTEPAWNRWAPRRPCRPGPECLRARSSPPESGPAAPCSRRDSPDRRRPASSRSSLPEELRSRADAAEVAAAEGDSAPV
jgi:hypothetical protein